MSELEKKVMDWISNIAPDVELTAETDLANAQVLDSLQIMDLVMHLEQDNGIAIPLDALTESNFKSPASIAAMVSDIQKKE